MEVDWSAGQFISYHFDMSLTWIDFKTYRKITVRQKRAFGQLTSCYSLKSLNYDYFIYSLPDLTNGKTRRTFLRGSTQTPTMFVCGQH